MRSISTMPIAKTPLVRLSWLFCLPLAPVTFTSVHAQSSPFMITAVERSGANVSLSFPTATGVTYYIQGSPDLKTWSQLDSTPGTGGIKTITLAGQGAGTARFFRVSTLAPAPDGFSFIPATTFTMGDQANPNLGDSFNEAVHTVTLSAYYMAQKEVSLESWQATYTWALANGYTFSNAGSGKGPTHPVHTITWHDAVKWCNARSRQENLQPCYLISAAEYKTGVQNNFACDFTKNGYRLPTESEWENAARGGLTGKNFPQGDTLTHSVANYNSDAFYAYDVSATRGFHPTWRTTGRPFTSPVGSFPANGFGLFDMAGNVAEWCWDRHDFYPEGPVTDPSGPPPGSSAATRILRGGSWFSTAQQTRVAYRRNFEPTGTSEDWGFRLARGRL